MSDQSPLRPTDDDPPPFHGGWNLVYAAVLLYLAFLIALFYAFERAFAA